MSAPSALLFSEKSENERERGAYDQACGERKVEAEILSPDSHVSREFPEEVELGQVGKKKSQRRERRSRRYQDPRGFVYVHAGKDNRRGRSMKSPRPARGKLK